MRRDFQKEHVNCRTVIWTTGKLAAYLGVSRSWVRKQIRAGRIKVEKGGHLNPWIEEGEREHYRISNSEVERLKMELPLPWDGKTYTQRKADEARLRELYDQVFENL